MTRINAVFEGGGVKGISLVGAVCASEEYGITFNHLAGTSSGSIVAAMLAAGYSSSEIKRSIEETPFHSLLRRGYIYNLGAIGPVVRLLVRRGFYSGEGLTDWIERLLGQKGVHTFADLPSCKLRIIASDITNGKLLVLPDDIADYGIEPSRLSVALAVRMSVSIPYFFDPVRFRMNGRSGAGKAWAYIVDGGLLSNFPLWLFDNEQRGEAEQVPTVGYQMVGKNETEPRAIRGPVSMFQAIFETMLQAHDERYIEKNNRGRTIKIPTLGIRSTQFHLTKQQSDNLYASGYDAASAFFQETQLLNDPQNVL
ncbi:patatin-like phospholipase family protein [Paenibacillus sp. sptzw28]|uniref:patatin-like phospholipase family protein n=1 Tax=Paenibacillus sp. sptzw28 TaxID=715179 RepID=UPI001C6EE45B|nr:patatin-like phospholipase family protein [Paenibacillus sp. sptzw28]QYR20023.1 patatin-like phospholipase family protein [Paenibacillus sp. sptzw28]